MSPKKEGKDGQLALEDDSKHIDLNLSQISPRKPDKTESSTLVSPRKSREEKADSDVLVSPRKSREEKVESTVIVSARKSPNGRISPRKGEVDASAVLVSPRKSREETRAELRDILAQNNVKLAERGDKLNTLSQTTDRLENAASTMRSLAHELREEARR